MNGTSSGIFTGLLKLLRVSIMACGMLISAVTAQAEPPSAHELKMLEAGWILHKYQLPFTPERTVWFRPYSTHDVHRGNPLYFRHKVPKKTWKYYRATNLLIPSYNLTSQYDREAVEGFELGGTDKGVSRFAYLQGIIISGGADDPEPTFFYESRPVPLASITAAGETHSPLPKGEKTDTSPKIPVTYLPAIESGQFVRFWDQVPPQHYDVLSVTWLYDDILYFQYNNKRHRTVYTTTPSLVSGRSDVFGFEVSEHGGMLRRFSLSDVVFADQVTPANKAASLPVGSVIASLLEPEKFRQAVGDPAIFDPAKSQWAFADDKGPVPGSTYAQLTGNTAVPDLRGVFLRGLNARRNDGKQDPDGSNRQAGDYQADTLGAHNHTGFSPSWVHNPRQNVAWARNNKGWNYAGSSSPVTTTGGKESRPRNVAVFYYVRIN